MSEPTVLRDMLVVRLDGNPVEVTRMGDEYPRFAISHVTATLVGYGIEITRPFRGDDIPRVGDRVDVPL